ncbi:MAG TPA: PH domain-containing protein [Acidimicrobiia bacterium]|nr:PH domain-containing protein [Acidimicrobiia bacterium]
MGYPERLLSDDEVIEAEFRPHWSGILREGVVILVGIALAVVLAIVGVPAWAYLALGGIVLILIARGLVRWLTTSHVITTERLIYRAGFIAKHGNELPLEVIQNVAFNQTIIERIFGTGDLMIESAGTHGQTRYRDIPNPEGVQSLIYRVRETRMSQVEAGRTGRPASSSDDSTVAQLERLSRLHDQGKLSDAEFEAEKAKLLGGSA